MERTDLHMHSSFSDGTDTPGQLVRKARDAGLRMIALTDHNTLDGIGAFRQACREVCQEAFRESFQEATRRASEEASQDPRREPFQERGIIGIDGIELSTGWVELPADGDETVLQTAPDFPDEEPQEIHLLGYFRPDSDLDAPEFDLLREVLADYRQLKIRHNRAILRRVIETGAGGGRLSIEGFLTFVRSLSDSGNYNRVHIARYLEKTGAAVSIDDAFDRFIGTKSPCYVPRRSVPMWQAVRAIHAARGTAVVAHLGEYRFTEEQYPAFFDYCLRSDVDGFELLHPHNSPETAQRILAFAEQFRQYHREAGSNRELLLTTGSDYHGANKLNRQGVPWGEEYSWN